MNDWLLWVTLAIMLVGLAGSVLPGLPGVPVIFLSALVYAYFRDFEPVGGGVIMLLGLFAALALAADFIGTTYGARRFGASNWGTVGGAIGGIVGTLVGFLFLGIGSLFGLILGTVGGIFLGEHLRQRRQHAGPERNQRDWRRTSRAAGGVFVGYVISAAAQGVLGLASVIAFVVALL